MWGYEVMTTKMAARIPQRVRGRLLAALLLWPALMAGGPAAAGIESTAERIAAVTELPAVRTPAEHHVVSGQPRFTDLEMAAYAGLEVVINLRGRREPTGYDMADSAAQLGLRYYAIPVADASALTEDSVRALDAALNEAGDGGTLLHCSSGNRVGAMMALRANWLYDADPEAALQLGRDYGLAGLEPTIRDLLVARDG